MKRAYTILFLAFISAVSLTAQTNLATDGANASASDAIAGGEASMAFDGDSTTGWVVTSSPVQWIRYDFSEAVFVNGYAMHYLVDSLPRYQPVSWTFEGSSDGSSWIPIDTVTDNTVFAEWEQFVTFNETAYPYYRLNITEAGGDTLAIGELQLYIIGVPTVITGEANYVEAQLASCSGNVLQTGGSPVLQRGICYNTTGNPTLADSWRTSSAGIGSYNTLLVNLQPNTTYYFRAFATNAQGTAYAGEIKTFTTQRLDQSIDFPAMDSKTYGDSDFDPGATASSGLTVSYNSSNPDVAVIVSNQVHIIGAGTTTITATQIGNSTYNAATPVARGLSVGKLQIQAIADDLEKTYGSSNPFFTVSYSGFINGDDAGDIDTEPGASCEATNFSNVGTYFITPSGGTDNNYRFEYIPGYLTITKAPLDLIVSNSEREYGDENPEFAWIYSGFLNGDDISDIDALPEAYTPATQTSDAGSYPISLGSGGDNNYEFVVTEGTLEIVKAPLSGVADDIAKTYGEANPELTCSYTGWKNNDNAGELDTLPLLYTTADETSVVGEYPIMVQAYQDNNYEITYLDGTLSVEQAFLNATVEDVIRYEEESNPEFVIIYSGFVNEDGPDDIDEAPVATCIADESSPPGNYAIEVSGGSDDNYFILTYNGLLTVLEKPDALDNTNTLLLRIYPNPAGEALYLEGECHQPEIQLTDLDGRTVLHQVIFGNQVDLSSVPAGIYLIRITEKGQLIYYGKVYIAR